MRSLRTTTVTLLVLLGCSQDQFAPPPHTDPAGLYFGVTLNHHAINLSTVAPYDTIRLVATPRNALGQPYPQPSKVVYTSNDLGHVQISPNGLVTAVGPVIGAVITAADTIGNLTHIDSAIVNVTDTTPPALAAFSIHPVPPDSAKWAAGFLPTTSLVPRATDASGNAMSGLTVDFEVSDTLAASVDRQSGAIQGLHPGHVTFYATTTAYGITKADTLPFTFGYPVAAFVYYIDMTRAFVPSVTIIGTGGSVEWTVPAPPPGKPADSIDVVFDDSARVTADTLFGCRCGSGNIPLFADSVVDSIPYAVVRARSFPVSGTYTYHSRLTHATGKIIVVPGTTAPPPQNRVRALPPAAIVRRSQAGRGTARSP